jgi:arylsulfatase A
VLGGYDLPLISSGRLTFPKMLKNIGYNTACIGKWHLGLEYQTVKGEDLDFTSPSRFDQEFESKIDFQQPISGGPLERGFEYFFGTASCPTCQAPYGFIENNRFIEPPSVYDNNPFYTSRPGMMSPGWKHKDVDPTFTRKAVEYIESRADSEKPFFLYLTPSAPHEPCVSSVVPEFARGKSAAGPRGDLVWLFDWMVGEILGVLKRAHLEKNTMLIVTSDNGALPGDRCLDEKGNIILDDNGEEYYHTYGHKSCYNWRGYKAHIWEGGHREPLLIRYPEKTKAGFVSDQLVCLTDFMETFAEMFNYNLLQNTAEDSVSFFPLITSNMSNNSRRKNLVHHSAEGVFSLRVGNWKYIHETTGSGGWPPPKGGGPQPGSPGQLYNIKKDPGEETNLYYKYLRIVNKLKKLLAAIINGSVNSVQGIND